MLFFDLEATSLSDDCEIAQVSAVYFDGLKRFDQYIYLSGSISLRATKVTDIKKSRKLFCHGKLVDAVEVNVGLVRFALLLKQFFVSVVLVGYNVKDFDVKHSWNNVKLEDLLHSCVKGFVDTLPLFRNIFP